MGKSFGRTTFKPRSSPVISESCFAKASLAFGVGVNGLPTPSRAPPKKKGIISTEMPYSLRRGRNLTVFVKANQEYGDTGRGISVVVNSSGTRRSSGWQADEACQGSWDRVTYHNPHTRSIFHRSADPYLLPFSKTQLEMFTTQQYVTTYDINRWTTCLPPGAPGKL